MIAACEAYLKVMKFIDDNELDDYYEECGCEEVLDTLCKDCRANEDVEVKPCVGCCMRRDEKCKQCGEKIRYFRVIFQQLDKLKSNPDLPSKEEAEKAVRFNEIVDLGTRCTRVNDDFIKELYQDCNEENTCILEDFYEIVYNNRDKDWYKFN